MFRYRDIRGTSIRVCKVHVSRPARRLAEHLWRIKQALCEPAKVTASLRNSAHRRSSCQMF